MTIGRIYNRVKVHTPKANREIVSNASKIDPIEWTAIKCGSQLVDMKKCKPMFVDTKSAG